jgi:exosortase
MGLAALFVAAGMQLAAAWWYYVVLAPYSLLPCLAGVCLLAGGWPLLRWTWPAIAFLVFMVPLPGRFEDMLGEPLQRAATIASTYAVQTMGVPAFAEGNVIVLSEAKIGVVEACSGLRMLILFFAISTAVAFLARRPLWERLLIVAGSVPIALTANVVRISATAAVYEWGDRAFAEKVFHDLSGWLMMPFALLLATLELWVLSHLFVPSKAAEPVALATVEVAPPRIAKPAPLLATDEKREAPGWRKRRRSTANRN